MGELEPGNENEFMGIERFVLEKTPEMLEVEPQLIEALVVGDAEQISDLAGKYLESGEAKVDSMPGDERIKARFYLRYNIALLYREAARIANDRGLTEKAAEMEADYREELEQLREYTSFNPMTAEMSSPSEAELKMREQQ